MNKSVWELLASMLGTPPQGSAAAQTPKDPVTLPARVFPLAPLYNYCELRYERGSNHISLVVRPKGQRQQSVVYTLDTTDMAYVQQLVREDGFSPCPDDLGFCKNTHFIDQESDNYFFSR